MKCINVYLTVALLLLSMQSIAQEKDKVPDKSQFKRLYIGDTVPMDSIVFNNVRNYPGGKAKLSDFKGKYIILDFWTKGCSSCIAAFPQMEELQNEFKNDIQVLLVTKNSENEIALLSKNSVNLKNTKLPVVIDDQILATQLFPHGTVPYHVWLDRTGKVVATTYAQETNQGNLQDLILGKKLNLLIKNEVFDEVLLKQVNDQRISLLNVGGGMFQEYLKYYAQIPETKIGNKAPEPTSSIPALGYYSMLMSYLPGEMMDAYRGLTYLLKENGEPKGLRISNYSIANLFNIAYGTSPSTKIIIDNAAKEFYEEITDTTNGKRFIVNNKYCYESCLPNYSVDNAKKLMQLDLSRFFRLIASVEERPIKHLILKRLGIKAEERLWMKGERKIPSSDVRKKEKDGWVFKGAPIQIIYHDLCIANTQTNDPIILDSTNFDNEELNKMIDVKFKLENFRATPKNIPLIRNELARYGLGLEEEIRNINVLVLRKSF